MYFKNNKVMQHNDFIQAKQIFDNKHVDKSQPCQKIQYWPFENRHTVENFI